MHQNELYKRYGQHATYDSLLTQLSKVTETMKIIAKQPNEHKQELAFDAALLEIIIESLKYKVGYEEAEKERMRILNEFEEKKTNETRTEKYAQVRKEIEGRS